MVVAPLKVAVGSGFTVTVMALFCGFGQSGAFVYSTLVMVYVVVAAIGPNVMT
jgi:hypothetical protein